MYTKNRASKHSKKQNAFDDHMDVDVVGVSDIQIPQSSVRSTGEVDIDDSSSVAESLIADERENEKRRLEAGSNARIGGTTVATHEVRSKRVRRQPKSELPISGPAIVESADGVPDALSEDELPRNEMTFAAGPRRFLAEAEVPPHSAHSNVIDMSEPGPVQTQNTQTQIESMAVVPAATAKLTPDVAKAVNSELYGPALVAGYHTLIKKLWEEEAVKNQRPSLTKLSYETFAYLCLTVLATIPTCYLVEIINNSLAHAHLGQKKQDVCDVYRLYNSKTVLDNVAGVYMISLVDENGLGPTAREWAAILDIMEDYGSWKNPDDVDLKNAYKIDRYGHPKHTSRANELGWRRYLPEPFDANPPNKNAPDYDLRFMDKTPADNSVNRLDEFIKGVDWRRCTVQKVDIETPMSVSYVGYSYKIRQRWNDHEKSPSSYLMALSSTICKVFFPERNFQLVKYVVCPLGEIHEGAIAEVIVAALANVYHKSGYGYNIAGAGESNDSMDKFTLHQQIVGWSWIRKHSPREANLEEQVQRLEAIVKAKRQTLQTRNDEAQRQQEQQVQTEKELKLLKDGVAMVKLRAAKTSNMIQKQKQLRTETEIAVLREKMQLLIEEKARMQRLRAALEAAKE